jgi:hypothetical protein
MADPASAVTPPVQAPPLPGGVNPPAASPAPEAVPPAGGTPPATELGAATPPAAEPPKAPEAPKSPEPVAFDATKLTLPEGMKADDPVFKSFAETFTDDKLDPQTRGQKLLDLYKDAVSGIREQTMKVWTDTNEAWKNQVRADPEIGGAKFEATKTTIAKAIDSLGPELSVAFRQGLDATGAGNHPAIWKGLAKMAGLLTEGGHVSGNPPASAKPTIKEAFYPNSPDMK